ncbi:MAG: hypothetical protein LBJ96_01755 [Holosporaceae bacterium]|jgi:hypothetical protein|nr:hypothetical protein [Holosporaceae bacterium]
MTDKNSEMSLDDVLSSIRKMVMDNEPPVLDLTDMVKPDGSIVKVKSPENADMSAFLKLVQENAASASHNERLKDEFVAQRLKRGPIVSADVLSCPIDSRSERKTDKNEAILELLKEIAAPSVNKWVENHLQDVVRQMIEERIKIVEGKIRDLFEKH